MTNVADSTQLFYSVLTKAGTPLYDLVGARVYAVMANPQWRNAEPAIVFSVLSETAYTHRSMVEGRVSFRCYGGTNSYSEARQVARALIDRLDNASETHDANGLITCFHEVSTLNVPDGDTGWPLVLAIFDYKAVVLASHGG